MSELARVNENVVIPLTGPGVSAVAVVRITGALTGDFLRLHFSKTPRGGRSVHGELRDGASVVDDVVVAQSQDGETADINLHGSPWIVARVIELAKQFGFGVIDHNGEPSLYGADGETAFEREVMAWLPHARSELGVRMLAAQVDAWEALLVSEPTSDRLKHMAADPALWRMLHPPRVAITGRPNVGKSTLANQLFGQERSITADLPGTTRDWVAEYTNVMGLPIMLVDTPGIRGTTDRIEADAIDGARMEIAEADLVLFVVDVTHEDAHFGEYPSIIRVINKCDLPGDFVSSPMGGVRISAKTGEGIDLLCNAIASRFGCSGIQVNDARWWTERQRAMLARGLMP